MHLLGKNEEGQIQILFCFVLVLSLLLPSCLSPYLRLPRPFLTQTIHFPFTLHYLQALADAINSVMGEAFRLAFQTSRAVRARGGNPQVLSALFENPPHPDSPLCAPPADPDAALAAVEDGFFWRWDGDVEVIGWVGEGRREQRR